MSLVLALLGLLGLMQEAPSVPSASEQKRSIEAYSAADWRTPAGRDERLSILEHLELVELTPSSVSAQSKAALERWKKGRKIDKDSGRAFFFENERGLYIVGGETRKPRALVVCLHGGGAGSGEAVNAFNGYNSALSALDWLAVYPQVLDKTEHGWIDSGTEEFVLELLEAARRTWKIDANRVFLVGHSMGGFGTWMLGAHHADLLAGLAPSAGAPTPLFDRSGQVVDILEGVIPNLRNLAIRIYQSDDDPRVPPETNRVAARRLQEAQERWGGFDFEYWEVSGQRHDPPPGGYGVQLEKIADRERTTHPQEVVWQPTLAWKQQFYWLFWEHPVENALVVARADRSSNEVHVQCDRDARGLWVLLDDQLLDLRKPVAVFLNDSEVFRGPVRHSLATVVATGEHGDPELAYSARVPLFR